MSLPKMNPVKHFLGELCPHGHDWNGTGHSLRYINSPKKRCVTCEQIRNQRTDRKEQRDRYRKTEQAKQARKVYMKSYRKSEKFREHNRRYLRKLRKTSKWQEYFRNYNRRYNQENAERLREQKKQYSQTPAGQQAVRNSSNNRRSREKGNYYSGWSVAEWNQRLQAFNNCCAYCGKGEIKLTIEHFIPVSQGAPNCLDNVIPACFDCNTSKRANMPEDWYPKQKFYDQERWSRILSVLGIKSVF